MIVPSLLKKVVLQSDRVDKKTNPFSFYKNLIQLITGVFL